MQALACLASEVCSVVHPLRPSYGGFDRDNVWSSLEFKSPDMNRIVIELSQELDGLGETPAHSSQ